MTRFSKKISAKRLSITVLALVAALVPATAYANDDSSRTENFVISAYYSALPGQSFYAMGDYLSEIRMNGGGTRYASGMMVKDAPACGIAAPPIYEFGTKMYIHELDATCVVYDRGGAIKGKRLDLHMGHGEGALYAALKIGKREVTVTIYPPNSSVAVSPPFEYGVSYSEMPVMYKSLPQDPLRFLRNLAIGDEGDDVARLQQIMKDLGYYDGQIDGHYGSNTEVAVKSFQLDQGVINESSTNELGSFGGSTVASIKAVTSVGRDEYFKFVPNNNFGRGATGDEVKKLQELLMRLGYLSSVTGVYDSTTVDAVYNFQLAEGIVSKESDSGAGYFGPATQLAMDKLLLMIELDAVKVNSDIADISDDGSAFSYLNSDQMFKYALKEGDSGEDVKRMQQLLVQMNYLGIEPTGYFGPVTSHAVFKFQQKMGLVTSKSDPAAGYVGPETRKSLNSILNSQSKVVSNIKETSSLVAGTDYSNDEKFSEELETGDRGVGVKMLQSFLKGKGYFNGAFTTEYFGEVTRSALLEYQMDNAIVSSKKDASAGRLDLTTISFINSQL